MQHTYIPLVAVVSLLLHLLMLQLLLVAYNDQIYNVFQHTMHLKVSHSQFELTIISLDPVTTITGQSRS